MSYSDCCVVIVLIPEFLLRLLIGKKHEETLLFPKRVYVYVGAEDEKTTPKFLFLFRRGVPECTKAMRKGQKGICFLVNASSVLTIWPKSVISCLFALFKR